MKNKIFRTFLNPLLSSHLLFSLLFPSVSLYFLCVV